MKLLFYRTYPLIDGSLTYKMRLAQALAERGHEVCFLFSCPLSESIRAEVEKAAPVYFSDDLPQLANTFPADVVYAGADGDFIPVVFDLRARYFPRAAVVFGAWASDSFIHKSRVGWSPDGARYRNFLRRIPAQNINFMGPTILGKHEAFAGRRFDPDTILPNALRLPNVFPETARPNRNHLVSLGRLAPSKEYLFAALDLLPRFPNLRMTIFGDGPYRQPLQQQASALGLADRVALPGEVPYSQVAEKLGEAGFFIGMGAAIIEAAALGIPAIQAIEYTGEPIVYGWFHDMTDGEVGEYRPGKPTVPLEQMFREWAMMAPETYGMFRKKSFERAQDYSIDNVIHRFIRFLENADPSFDYREPAWKRMTIKLLRQPFKLLPADRKKTIGKT